MSDSYSAQEVVDVLVVGLGLSVIMDQCESASKKKCESETNKVPERSGASTVVFWEDLAKRSS